MEKTLNPALVGAQKNGPKVSMAKGVGVLVSCALLMCKAIPGWMQRSRRGCQRWSNRAAVGPVFAWTRRSRRLDGSEGWVSPSAELAKRMAWRKDSSIAFHDFWLSSEFLGRFGESRSVSLSGCPKRRA